MKFLRKKRILIPLAVILLFLGAVFLLAQKEVPEEIQYGMSFNTLYAEELNLDWKEAYDAILNELGVRHLRLAAHWPMVEPINDVYNFAELDYQIERAEEVGAEVRDAGGGEHAEAGRAVVELHRLPRLAARVLAGAGGGAAYCGCSSTSCSFTAGASTTSPTAVVTGGAAARAARERARLGRAALAQDDSGFTLRRREHKVTVLHLTR